MLPQSMPTTVSPPPRSHQATTATTSPRKTRKVVQKEHLNPRHVLRAPVPHAIRFGILNKLHNAMAALNQRLMKESGVEASRKQALTLSADELIVMALDEEEQYATEHLLVYRSIVGGRILALQRMSLDMWLRDVQRWLGLEPEPDPSSSKAADAKEEKPALIETGLTPTQEIAFLTRFYANKTELLKCGYVLEPPSEAEIQQAKKGAEAAKGWEQCERCGTRFQVFPGRREDGSLTSGGLCRYHYAKPISSGNQGTLAFLRPSESVYPCCHAPSSRAPPGCTTCGTHVYKVTGGKRLASILQFEKTPPRPEPEPESDQNDSYSAPAPKQLRPLSFDCEMCYTTLGLELIRLTAASWPEGGRVLDVLVRPMGEILDFNARYSGISAEDFAQAVPHDPGSSATAHPSSTPDSVASDKKPRLTIVDSITEARSLLFSHLSPSTPLIGHSMENDLNVCRIIHPTIVDTGILFPHPRGLPMRTSLRLLAQKNLGRQIQQASSQSGGHDSLEDAVTTGDLVRWKIRFVWPRMKKEGWTFDGDNLVPPPVNKTAKRVAPARPPSMAEISRQVLRPGGTKRKI